MKNKDIIVKGKNISKIIRGIYLTGAVLILAALIYTGWFYFFGHMDLRKYKKQYDKVFDSGYTITCKDTKTEWGISPIVLPLPTRVGEYYLEYTDRYGNEREINISGDYYNLFVFDTEFYKKTEKWLLMNDIDYEESHLTNEDIYDRYIKDNFDCELEDTFKEDDITRKYKGDGFTIFVSCMDRRWDVWTPDVYSYDKNDETRFTNFSVIEDAVSVENLSPLSTYGIDDYANDKGKTLSMVINVNDDDRTPEELEAMANGFAQKLEAIEKDYASHSDFGGNYKIGVSYSYSTDEIERYNAVWKDDGTEVGTMEEVPVYKTEVVRVLQKNVVFGEDITQKGADDQERNTLFRDMIFEKNGWE